MPDRRQDETRDIYRNSARDFTPQIAREQLEQRQRDLRRNRLVSLFFGGTVVILVILLVAGVVHGFLGSPVSAPVSASPKDEKYIPLYSPAADEAWVLEYRRGAEAADTEAEAGPKPLSAKWIKKAAYYLITGQQALAVDAPEQALENFQRAVAIFPDMQGIQREIGMLYLQQKKYTEAAAHLEQALEEEETFDVLNNLGAACIGAKEYEKAEKTLLRACELYPENPLCHKNLAVLYRETGRADDALYQFEKYFELQPNDIDTMQTYAFYLTELGRWKEAATFLTALTQKVTDVAPIYFLLARVQIQNGQQDEALAALRRGTRLIDPELALAWMNRDEFDAVRSSGEFKQLVNQLELAAVSLEDPR
jgi:Tfp pilus assembly protein PilF